MPAAAHIARRPEGLRSAAAPDAGRSASAPEAGRSATAPSHTSRFAGEDTRSLALADGRTLSYTLYGAKAGPLVVVLDGPGSRGLARAASPIAAELGIRLVAPDRPGFFASTPGGSRRIADWPEDHAALLDALGEERAGIVSQSGGTPYALAAAAALPERVAGLAMLGAMGPMTEPEVLAQAGKQIRVAARLSRRAPWLLRRIFAAGGRQARRDPEKAAAKTAKHTPPADAKVLADPALLRIHVETSAEILTAPPRSLVREIRLLASPWEVDFARITAPAAFWTGDSDVVHPVPHAQGLAKRLGGAPVHVVPDAATFGLVPHYGEALRLAANA
ncbi:MAG TPA: alpha/beta hydrolase [Solirubrobacteraceae bacterium]|nr:alpha/beta hydrolase [Solirubrobacteraceae bacterium]